MKAQGYINENNFVKMFNNIVFKYLPFNAQLFIENVYPNIRKNDKIISFLGNGKEKTDIIIKINNTTFRISIKMGHKNSVHVENVYDFTKKLRLLNISQYSKENFLKYHFGDGTKNGKSLIRENSKNLIKIYRKELSTLNIELENLKVKKYLIKNTIIGNPEIDYLIYGTPIDFIWISKNEIIELMINAKFNNTKLTPHISMLTLQPMNRCINLNPKYNRFRYYVQFKWYNIYDDILEYKFNNNQNILF